MTNPGDVTAVGEIERKYDAAPDGVLPDPGELLGGDRCVPAEDQLLEAVYFDTADLRLLAEGVTLRRRVGGADSGWHLKLPAGRDQREELRLPLTRARNRPPAELVALVRAFSRGADLGPVAEVTTHRRAWTRTDADGAPLVELVDDQVSAVVTGDESGKRAWREIEVELGEGGSRALLEEIEQRLVAAGLQRSGTSSKLGRVLDGRLPARSDRPVDPTSSAGAAVLAYLDTQARALRRHDPLVRLDRPDAVHQMRVAARRMRSVLQAFGRIIERNRTRVLTEELAWFAGELAPARDTEVMAERFETLVAGIPDDLVLGPVHSSMTRIFAGRAADARQQGLAALDGDRYLALLRGIDALLADPPLTRRADRPAGRELPRAVAAVYERFARRIAAAEVTPAGTDRDLALHETRKAAKRLRYATETAVPVIGAPARRLQRRLAAVQDLLGDHQDTAVSRPVLRSLSEAAHLAGDNGFTYGLMYAAESRRAEHAQEALPATWKRMRRARTVRWLQG